ncbi:hypothetical protein D3C85_1155300 [compost metagenome]
MPGDTGNGLRQEERRSPALLAHELDLIRHALGVTLAKFLERPLIHTTVGIRDGRLEHMVCAPFTGFTLVFVRAQVDQFLGSAVVSPIQHDRIVTPGVIARHTQHEAVGFTSRTTEGSDRQTFRQSGGEPLCILDDIVVQVARVGVQA